MDNGFQAQLTPTGAYVETVLSLNEFELLCKNPTDPLLKSMLKKLLDQWDFPDCPVSVRIYASLLV